MRKHYRQQHRPVKRDGSVAPEGPFEAVSRRPDGTLYRTRHHTAEAAAKRLAGNPRHTHHETRDHRAPAEVKAVTE